MRKWLFIALSIWLYVGWFGCVLFGRSSWGIASLIFPSIAWALFWYLQRPDGKILFKLTALSLIGILFDFLMASLELLNFDPSPEFGVLPLWMISLWLLFAVALVLLSRAFHQRYWLAALVGAIAGPLSYHSGEAFGVMDVSGVEVLVAYGIFWGLYFPAAIFWLQYKRNIGSERYYEN